VRKLSVSTLLKLSHGCNLDQLIVTCTSSFAGSTMIQSEKAFCLRLGQEAFFCLEGVEVSESERLRYRILNGKLGFSGNKRHYEERSDT
jgi:hypothetical protein